MTRLTIKGRLMKNIVGGGRLLSGASAILGISIAACGAGAETTDTVEATGQSVVAPTAPPRLAPSRSSLPPAVNNRSTMAEATAVPAQAASLTEVKSLEEALATQRVLLKHALETQGGLDK